MIRTRCLFLICLFLVGSAGLNACKDDAKTEAEAQAKRDAQKTLEQENALGSYVDEHASSDADKAAIEAQLRKSLLSDPTDDPDETLAPLNADEEAAAKKGLDSKLIKDTSTAEAVAREIGKRSQGILGDQKIQFSEKEDFRCKANDADAKGFRREILTSKPVVGGVAILRIRTSDSPVLADVQNYSVRLNVSESAMTYTNDPDTSFSVHGASLSPGESVGGHLEAKIDGKAVSEDYTCVKGPE